ncbi:hypothetical protein QTP88_011359 [Uroleucon formosanum]
MHDENIEKSDNVLLHVENKNLIETVQSDHFDARKNDIALFTRRDLLSDEEKNNVSFLNANALCLKFQHKWLNEFNWLIYSEVEGGAFCKHCVVFAKTGGKGNQPLKCLVTEVFRTHSALEYHTFSILKSDEFLKMCSIKEPTIVERLDTDRIKQIKVNRERLIPIIGCVILCGRQEIALLGHKDYGKIDSIAILKYRSYGDEYLKHILTSEGRNKYLTPQMQNEIITACGDIILRKIVKDVNASQCFSILVDVITDISTVEQMAMCVRYVDNNNCNHERFPKFITINNLTGCDLAESILNVGFFFGLPLCKLLQKEQIDLREAVSLAEDIINVLKNIRLNCDTEFHKLFLLAKEMSVIINIELSTKRISKRQVNRANPDPNLSVEEYYKVSVLIPYLDFFIKQLEERFSTHSEIVEGFQSIFSYTLTSNEEYHLENYLNFIHLLWM